MLTKRTDILFTWLAIVVDLATLFLAFITAYLLRSETDLIQIVSLWPLDQYIKFVLLILPIWLIIFAIAGLYSTRSRRARWGEFTKVFMAISAGFMFFVAWVFLSRTFFFSRLIVIYAWILAILFVYLGRLIVNGIQRSLYRYKVGIRTVIIIGQTETAETLKHELERRKDLGYEVINGLIEPDLKILKQFLSTHERIDEIIVADSDLSSATILDLIALSEEHGIAFRLVPNLFEVKSTNVEFETLAAIPVIAYRRTPLYGWPSIVKRIFDIIVSGLALLLLSPVFVFISLLIKLDSRGTVYYKHKRLGLNKKDFYLIKFRTMKMEYCTGDGYSGKSNEEIFSEVMNKPELVKEFQKQQKLKNDPRITKIGNILRKTSLDELPQLFNVFLGQLSLVGPRPIVEAEIAKYGIYKHRLFIVKPGVTGLWQVSGRSDMPYKERVKLDMYYIENWSLWSDIIILVKTFFVVLFRKNAY